MAIQGNGFFIVQGDDGSQQYTRNGTFTTNSESQLVTSTGNRVMGYGITNKFEIDTASLEPLSIPLGTASVAKATTSATLQGTLTSQGPIATTAQVIESNILTDGSLSYPSTGPTTTIATDPTTGDAVPGGLSGKYTYYITYVNGNTQSRPQAVGSETPLLDNNQLTLSNIPADTTGAWTSVDIYRSVNSPAGNTNFYLVGTEPSAANPTTFTDTGLDSGTVNQTDASIIANGQILNFDGPAATSSTPLTDLVMYDGTNYNQVFPTTGSLAFTGTKGGSSLTSQTLKITNSSTLSDLANFLQGSLGIQTSPGSDPTAPIPDDAGTGLPPGVTITTSGQIEIVGNNGTANAVGIPLSSLQLTTNTDPPTTSAVNLPFNTTQTAIGQSTSTQMIAYDSLGNPLNVTITADLEKQTNQDTIYRWYADCGQNDPGTGQESISVGTGILEFDGQGNLVAGGSNTTVSIQEANSPAAKPLQFNLDFSQVSGLADATASLSVAN